MTQKIILLLVFVFTAEGHYEQNPADPNFIGCAIERHSTMLLKAGDIVPYKMFAFGGFFESRNEPCFNQNVLPNHNWRGYFLAETHWPLMNRIQSVIDAIIAVEHESAHATMGIVEDDLSQYLMIYDSNYRKVSMNALKTGARLYMFDQMQTFTLISSFDVYAGSKNTPELPGMRTTHTVGFSCKGKYRLQISEKVHCFMSFHERFIARSSLKKSGEIYISDNNKILKKKENYPIIKDVNTFSLSGGIGVPLFESRHFLEFHVRWLAGHPGGFVDSRDKRNFYSAGIALSRR